MYNTETFKIIASYLSIPFSCYPSVAQKHSEAPLKERSGNYYRNSPLHWQVALLSSTAAENFGTEIISPQ